MKLLAALIVLALLIALWVIPHLTVLMVGLVIGFFLGVVLTAPSARRKRNKSK